MTAGLCLRCKLEIPAATQQNEVSVCPHCGWVKSPMEALTEERIANQFIKVSIGMSALFIVAFIHAVNWGPYFFEAIPLKAKSIVGMARAQDYKRLALICMDLKDSACVERMLSAEVNLNPKDLDLLAELGNVQMLSKRYANSVQTYGKYFRLGGKSLDASYAYAKALGEVGQVDQAIKHYERILASKPNTLQITVTHAYVQMLIKNGRNQKAFAVIKAIRSKGENAAFFMETEIRKLASR